MGGAIGVSLSYEKQRRQLRQALIMEVIGEPGNKDLLENISKLRGVLIANDHICATAAREKANKFDHSATSTAAAFHELERLFTIYETSRILKSAKIRAGPVACPLGHHCTHFASMEEHPIAFSGEKGRDVEGNKVKPVICNICDKKTSNGYHCGYCEYNLCKMCCTVYCVEGHEMKLWTAGESDCSCAVCHTHPIYSGYRCLHCEDYDICDYCTYRDGRQTLAHKIMVKMEDNLSYMRAHMSESYTANHTVTNLKVQVGAGEGAFPTIWHLVQFASELDVLRQTSMLEVVQTRISTEILRLREVLMIHPDLCATAAREVALASKFRSQTLLIADTFFTTKEASRLRSLVTNHFRARSSLVRQSGEVACPLGHLAYKYGDDETPSHNMLRACARGVVKAQQVPPPFCKVCERLCQGGYYCAFCEYSLCKSCKVVYCSEGHEMLMWTIPEARGQRCYVCQKQELTQGYHCRKCFINLCDMCTRKERRLNIRGKWDEELIELMQYMHDQRYKSDIAKYYHWRQHTQVVSLGILCDLVRELRLAKYKAEKQVKFKPLIDKMKLLRADLAVYKHLSATAEYEGNRNIGHDGYFFKNKKEAKRELHRMQSVVKVDLRTRDERFRQAAGIACPLGHAMCHMRDISLMPVPETKAKKIKDESTSLDGQMGVEDAFANAFADFNSTNSSMEETENTTIDDAGMVAEGLDQGADDAVDRGRRYYLTNDDKKEVPLGSGEYQKWYEEIEETSDGPIRVVWTNTDSFRCYTCNDPMPFGGMSCPMCEKSLCKDCAHVYCKQGHEMKIWTSLEAHEISCVLCQKQRLIMGYRCVECNIDICDNCTSTEAREGMKRWPMREVRKLMTFIESIKLESEVAAGCYHRTLEYFEAEDRASMSRVCGQLVDLRESIIEAEEEIKHKKAQQDAYKYALTSTDF
jgi:hypothetical protein